jgi:FKBP-type peptidyl-prolyl cis-trans isomerase FklB
MEKISYALGLSIGNNILQSGIQHLNVDRFSKAMVDVLSSKTPEFSNEEAQAIINEFFEKLQQKQFEANVLKDNFFRRKQKKSEVITLESGLQYIVLKDAQGAKPLLRIGEVSLSWNFDKWNSF